jgi:hypothetical protein
LDLLHEIEGKARRYSSLYGGVGLNKGTGGMSLCAD